MDFTVRGTVNGSEPIHRVFDVAAGAAATIAPGDVVEIANGYAAKSADGGCAAAAALKTGLAVSTSTDTVGAAGTVEVVFSPVGLVVEGSATTASNLVTAVLFDSVSLDVDGSGNQTVDENAAGGILIYELDSDSATTGIARFVLPFNLDSA